MTLPELDSSGNNISLKDMLMKQSVGKVNCTECTRGKKERKRDVVGLVISAVVSEVTGMNP